VEPQQKKSCCRCLGIVAAAGSNIKGVLPRSSRLSVRASARTPLLFPILYKAREKASSDARGWCVTEIGWSLNMREQEICKPIANRPVQRSYHVR
jgi:hypothetical protein